MSNEREMNWMILCVFDEEGNKDTVYRTEGLRHRINNELEITAPVTKEVAMNILNLTAINILDGKIDINEPFSDKIAMNYDTYLMHIFSDFNEEIPVIRLVFPDKYGKFNDEEIDKLHDEYFKQVKGV